jgi:hypothetical protein
MKMVCGFDLMLANTNILFPLTDGMTIKIYNNLIGGDYSMIRKEQINHIDIERGFIDFKKIE